MNFCDFCVLKNGKTSQRSRHFRKLKLCMVNVKWWKYFFFVKINLEFPISLCRHMSQSISVKSRHSKMSDLTSDYFWPTHLPSSVIIRCSMTYLPTWKSDVISECSLVIISNIFSLLRTWGGLLLTLCALSTERKAFGNRLMVFVEQFLPSSIMAYAVVCH